MYSQFFKYAKKTFVFEKGNITAQTLTLKIMLVQ